MKWTDRVRSKMREKKLKQRDIAERLNVTEGAVSHYLTGFREPSIVQLRELSRMLDMSLGEMLGDDATFIQDKDELKAVGLMKRMTDEQKLVLLKMMEGLADAGDT